MKGFLVSKKISIVVGSNRPNRSGHIVADWVKKQAESLDSEATFPILDLKEIDLPFLDEPESPSSGNYQNAHTLEWAKMIEESDAIIFVSPEYNGGYSAVMKNAIDSIYAEWNEKPAAIVGYGGGPGLRAAAQLKHVLEIIKMQVVEEQVNIRAPWEAFEEDGSVKDSHVTGELDTLVRALEDLI